jgi:N-acetylmuramoyl-L-alanine amidase
MLRKLIEFFADVTIWACFSFLMFLYWIPDRHLIPYVDKEFPAAAEAYRIASSKVKIIERIPPPYQNCALEHQWCDRLAEALVYEARGEGSVGMRAVAYVILERKKSKNWPSTIREVVEQRKQFSYLEDMHRQKTPTDKDFDIAYKEAYDAYFGLSENPVPGAKWYHSTSIKPPKWTKDLEVVKTLGNHIFYKEKSVG